MEIITKSAWEQFVEQIELLTQLNVVVNNFFKQYQPEDMFDIPDNEVIDAYHAAEKSIQVSVYVLQIIPNAYVTAIAEEKNRILNSEEKAKKAKEFVNHYNMVVDATITRMNETKDTYIPILERIAKIREIKL